MRTRSKQSVINVPHILSGNNEMNGYSPGSDLLGSGPTGRGSGFPLCLFFYVKNLKGESPIVLDF